MIERLRRGVLSANGAALDPDEDFSGEEKLEGRKKKKETPMKNSSCNRKAVKSLSKNTMSTY
jgi:hypothetical protein